MHIQAIKTPVFKEGQDLIAFITKKLPRAKNGSIIVIASKIVSLAESRAVPVPTSRKMIELIRAMSEQAVRTKHVWLTVKDGMVMANAGIDASNADKKLILLPKDSYASAKLIRASLKKAYKIKKLGIIIADSCPLPLRAGVTSLALGYAGFKATREYRGKKDIFGRKLVMTRTNIADGLSAAAGVLMGEGAERQPLAIITDAPVEFSDRSEQGLLMPASDDMYAPLFKSF